MDFPNQKPTEENSDYFQCGICLEQFQGEKHLLLCKCPANTQNCRNGGCIRCLLWQESSEWYMNNWKCASCCKPVTKQDIDQVLYAAMEAAVDCCLAVRCQKPGNRQAEIECLNEDCFNQLHRECLLSLINSKESTHISCPLCDKNAPLIEWRSYIQSIDALMEAEEKRKGSHLSDSYSPKKTLAIPPVEAGLQDEVPMDTTEFDVPNL